MCEENRPGGPVPPQPATSVAGRLVGRWRIAGPAVRFGPFGSLEFFPRIPRLAQLADQYGITVGASYVFTTCVPSGVMPGTGDSVISAITDNTGLSYNVSNDDCGDPTTLVRLAGW